MNRIIVIAIFLLYMVGLFAQTTVAVIPLDSSLEEVRETMQFSAGQGNVLFKFRGRDFCQYSILRQDSVVKSEVVKLGDNYDFLEYFHDEKNFNLFYRDRKKENIYTLIVGEESYSELLKTNIENTDEKYLTSCYNQGDLLVFKYSESPFTLHTYRYRVDQEFEKKSQVFDNEKGRRFFLGYIMNAGELVFVQTTIANPFVFYFYRYRKDKGFEEKMIDIRSVYKKAGFKTKVFPKEINFNAATQLSASVQDSHVYLDMENLIKINPSFSKSINLKQHPGVLWLDWESDDCEIITFDKNNTNYANRSVALSGDFYFKLLVSKHYLDMSIFELSSKKLLKKYAYNRGQQIDVVYEGAKLSKTKSINLNFSTITYLPININRPKEEIIDDKELLKNLSAGTLFMDAYSDGSIIELNVTGIRQKEMIFDVNLAASFTGYFSKSDLSIIKNLGQLEDARYTEIESYLKRLTSTNENISNTIVYAHKAGIYLSYIDEKAMHCNLVRF